MKPGVPGPVRLADRVWLWPSDPDPSRVHSAVGVIVGDHGTLLIDAGNSPEHAARIHRWLLASGFPPLQGVVFTHHHWDHTFGACALEVPVIAHESCHDLLQDEAKRAWNASALQEEMAQNPRLTPSHQAKLQAIKDWATFRIVTPGTVFRTGLSLDPGGCPIELAHVGGGHASDSILVRIPSARMLFLGDCHYPPPLHLRSEDSAPDRDLLASLLHPGFDLYVEGHGESRTREQVRSSLGV